MLSQFGFYEAMGRAETNKLSAFAATVPKGHRPHWNFNEKEFARYDWSIEPDESLEALYKLRAKQIREKYDYVIISYSGGADSHNIAESFVRCGLRIDELINRFSANKIDLSCKEKIPENLANESIWAAIPGYKRLRYLQPDLRFTRWDWSQDIIDSWEQNKKNIYEINYPSPNANIKQRLLQHSNAKSHQDTVVIYGVDKPYIIFHEGRFYIRFLDEIVHGQVAWTDNINDANMDNTTCELFYWSPNATRLLIKQAHMVKKWFKANPGFLFLLDPFRQPNRDLYNQIVNGIVYPWHCPDVWQCAKQKRKFFTIEEKWFISNDSSTAVANWKKIIDDMNYEISNIYKHSTVQQELSIEEGKFLLPGCYSKAYDLGT